MNGFVIYRERADLAEELTNEQMGIVFKSLCRYAFDGLPPDIKDQAAKIVFSIFKGDIDRASEKYEQACKRNRENGLKGGRPKTESVLQETQNNRVGFSETQNNPQKPNTEHRTITYNHNLELNKEPPAPKCPLFEHEEVVTAWREYTEMRKKIKKPITTDRTKTMAINKLMELSGGKPEEAVKVLNQSVDHCWVGLFAIKEDWKPRERQRQAYEPKDERRTNYDSVMRELFVQSIKEG